MRWRIGTHEGWLDGNVVVLRTGGTISGPEMQEMTDEINKAIALDAKLYMMVDAEITSGMSPAARKVAVEWVKQRNAQEYFAYYKISFTYGTILQLMANATRLLSARAPDVKTFRLESDARQWLGSKGARFAEAAALHGSP
jgi:hypothetical protein